jgi:hypothetical protein
MRREDRSPFKSFKPFNRFAQFKSFKETKRGPCMHSQAPSRISVPVCH